MIINSTDIQNNFGKYILLAAKEDIIITKNGRKVAVLKSYQEEENENGLPVEEKAPEYNWDRKRVSYEEFLKISRESEERYEYINGEIYLLASPKTTHQKALGELYSIFYNLFKGKKCIPMIAPYDIRLKRHKKDINVVQPDLMVICDLEDKLGADDYYYGVPSLVLEIISNSTRGKDYLKKLDLYMSCGVSEYWIVDPVNREIHVYSFKDKDIEMNRTFRENDTISSFLFTDLRFRANDVF